MSSGSTVGPNQVLVVCRPTPRPHLSGIAARKLDRPNIASQNGCDCETIVKTHLGRPPSVVGSAVARMLALPLKLCSCHELIAHR